MFMISWAITFFIADVYIADCIYFRGCYSTKYRNSRGILIVEADHAMLLWLQVTMGIS